MLVDRPSVASLHLPACFEPIIVETYEAPTTAASSTGRRQLRDIIAFSRVAARARLDLLYFPASYSYFPVWGVPRVVVTMHDTLALAHPEWVFPTWQGRLAWRLKESVAAWQADRIVTVSEASRADLITWFRLPSERVAVMTEGPDPIFQPSEPGPHSDRVLARYGVSPRCPYLLYVGGLSPHKNLPRLIEALAMVNRPDLYLVIVGDFADVFHTQIPELKATITKFDVGDRVVLTGFVPDVDLVSLYGRALALVQPSLMEGFGLPPIEAMACGTPVLASNAGSLPEVIGSAGLFFDPLNVEEMATTIRSFLAHPTSREVALARASLFTWEAGAKALIEVFQSVAPSA